MLQRICPMRRPASSTLAYRRAGSIGRTGSGPLDRRAVARDVTRGSCGSLAEPCESLGTQQWTTLLAEAFQGVYDPAQTVVRAPSVLGELGFHVLGHGDPETRKVAFVDNSDLKDNCSCAAPLWTALTGAL